MNNKTKEILKEIRNDKYAKGKRNGTNIGIMTVFAMLGLESVCLNRSLKYFKRALGAGAVVCGCAQLVYYISDVRAATKFSEQEVDIKKLEPNPNWRHELKNAFESLDVEPLEKGYMYCLSIVHDNNEKYEDHINETVMDVHSKNLDEIYHWIDQHVIQCNFNYSDIITIFRIDNSRIEVRFEDDYVAMDVYSLWEHDTYTFEIYPVKLLGD